MAFELPNGKTARTLPEQVKFLTEKLKEIIAALGDLKMKVEIVETLPEEGKSLTIYFVASSDPDLQNIYKEYMWIDEQWELIGTTEIDLSNYMTLNSDQSATGIKTFLSGIVLGASLDFGNNAKINKDSSNRINILFGDAIKIKVGSNETYFANHVEPDSPNSFDLGRLTLRWRRGYIDFLNDGSNDVSTTDLIALVTYAKAQGWIS